MFESEQFAYINQYLTVWQLPVVLFSCLPPKTKFPIFGAALLFPNTIITNYCFSAILKGLKLSSSSSAVNTSQFDNCQSFCCHVCPENKVSEFWRRSTLSKYNCYKLLLFCNFKRFEAEQFFFSGQYLTVWQLPVVLLSCLPRKQSFRVLAPLYPSKYNCYKLLLFCNFKRFEAEQFFFSGQYLTVLQLPVVSLSCLSRKRNLRILAPLYFFQIQLLETIAFLQF